MDKRQILVALFDYMFNSGIKTPPNRLDGPRYYKSPNGKAKSTPKKRTSRPKRLKHRIKKRR